MLMHYFLYLLEVHIDYCYNLYGTGFNLTNSHSYPAHKSFLIFFSCFKQMIKDDLQPIRFISRDSLLDSS